MQAEVQPKNPGDSDNELEETEEKTFFYKLCFLFLQQSFINDRERDTVEAEIRPKDPEDSNNEETEEKTYRMEEVKGHWETDSCWMVIHDIVYDITAFIATVRHF